MSIDKKAKRLSDKSMKSVCSNIAALLIVLMMAGLLGNTPAKAMTLDSMSAEVADCQNCGNANNMQNMGAICSSVCIVSVMTDETAIESITIHGAKKTQFETLISRLRERSEYPDPHPPKHTS
ncbi:MAG: hypothetical protein V7723_17925 [Sneathiella sp.]|uniref:hypothetical protein n=1 Tax=Sneathiella sp. TaxID=1964365 RepID=UPI00300163C7